MVLTLLMAVPVLNAPDQRIFGNEIVGRHHDPFTVMRQFAGAPVEALYYQPATDWPGRLLARVMSPVAAYSVVVLATFPLAAWFGYLLAIDLTASRLAGAVAALAFAFSPFHLAHAAYHPHIAQVQWIALFLFAVWRCVQGFTWRRALLLIAASALVATSNFYGGFIAAAIAPAAVVIFWVTRPPASDAAPRRRADLLKTVALLATLAAASLLLLLWLLPDVLAGDRVPRAAYGDLYRYSARWWAHLVPPVDHAVLGAWSRQTWAQHGVGGALLEQQLYLGYGLMALAAVAASAWALRSHDPELRAVPGLLVMAALACVLALSPSREIGSVSFVRPSAFLYELAPMFRSYARFSAVVQLTVAILGGLGVSLLWKRHGQTGKAIALALLVVTVFEYAPVPWRWRHVLPTSGHRWLATQDAVRAFDCSPLNLTDRPTAFLARFSITYADPAASECGESAAASRLRARGITHVILRPGSPAWALLEARTPAGMRRVYGARDGVIFEIVESSPAVFATAGHGWHAREYSTLRSWRWTSGDATLEIINPHPVACSVQLTVELGSFDAPRRVELLLGDAPLEQRVIGSNVTAHALPSMVIQPGGNALTVKTIDPPVAPVTVDASSTDRRLLAIVVRDWHVSTRDCSQVHAELR